MGDKPFTVPAEGVVNYQIYEVDPGFKEDRWISAGRGQGRQSGRVHHVIVFIQQPGGERFGAPQMAYAPGMTPRRFDKGMAIRAPAGSKLIFQMPLHAQRHRAGGSQLRGFRLRRSQGR